MPGTIFLELEFVLAAASNIKMSFLPEKLLMTPSEVFWSLFIFNFKDMKL